MNKIMDFVITEPYASLILWNHPMLILHKFLVRYNNVYFCSAVGQSHLFLLGSLVCELYTFTAADYKT